MAPLGGQAVAWLPGVISRPCPVKLADKQLGTIGSLPVSQGSSPVECGVPVQLLHIADSRRCHFLVRAGDSLVRLGRGAECLYSRGQREGGGSLRLGLMALGRFQPLAD